MFRGSIVALVTPFRNDEIDFKALAELVEFHIAAGTHAIVAAGTTGESGTLTQEEKLAVIRSVVTQSRERIPVIAGTGMNATRACIELTRAAVELGAHAALIMTPAYIKPTQEGLYQHYCRISEAVPIPLIVYNVPSRTACDLLPETLGRIASCANIIGIKEAVGQMDRLKQLLAICGDRLDIFSGEDAVAAEWILGGAKGVISVTANIAPRFMAKLCDLALDKAETECLALNEQLLALHHALFIESNPIPVKWALSKIGLISEEIRLPLTPLTEKNQLKLEPILKKLELA